MVDVNSFSLPAWEDLSSSEENDYESESADIIPGSSLSSLLSSRSGARSKNSFGRLGLGLNNNNVSVDHSKDKSVYNSNSSNNNNNNYYYYNDNSNKSSSSPEGLVLATGFWGSDVDDSDSASSNEDNETSDNERLVGYEFIHTSGDERSKSSNKNDDSSDSKIKNNSNNNSNNSVNSTRSSSGATTPLELELLATSIESPEVKYLYDSNRHIVGSGSDVSSHENGNGMRQKRNNNKTLDESNTQRTEDKRLGLGLGQCTSSSLRNKSINNLDSTSILSSFQEKFNINGSHSPTNDVNVSNTNAGSIYQRRESPSYFSASTTAPTLASVSSSATGILSNEDECSREMFLSISEICRSQTEFLTKLGLHVERQRDLNENVVKLTPGLVFYGSTRKKLPISARNSKHLPREAFIVQEAISDLDKQIHSFSMTICKCLTERSDAFEAEVRRIKDAYCRVVENERNEANSSMFVLQDSLDRQKDSEVAALRNQITDLDGSRTLLYTTLAAVQEECRYLKTIIERHKVEQDQAVNAAVLGLKDVFENEKIQIHRVALQEQQKIKEEYTKQLETSLNQIKMQVESQERHDKGIRSALITDKDTLQKEVDRLLGLSQLSAKSSATMLSNERDKANEMKHRFEADISQLKSDHLSEITSLRSQLQQSFSNCKQMEVNLKTDFEKALQREKETHSKLLASEAERQEEQYKDALRRVRLSLEAQNKEDVARMHKLHKDEINRVMNENERLQSLLLGGLNELSNAIASPDKGDGSFSRSSHSTSKNMTYSNKSNTPIKNTDFVRSNSRSPPSNLFPDDALETSQYLTAVRNAASASSSSSSSIARNADNVNLYMLQLEKYLKSS